MGKLRIGLLVTVVLYLLYTWILFKPPRKGWDLLTIKISMWLSATLLAIVLFAGYWVLFKEE
ncbi:MAG: hypothetical protein F7B60_02130 [Desulfurococcales archaeon]|nr:hypothetical protein [Desulfurococcales archaeon]